MSHSKTTHAVTVQQSPKQTYAAVPASPTFTHEDIARRAFDIYVGTGRRQGQCTKNWHQAEQDLRNQGKTACHTA